MICLTVTFVVKPGHEEEATGLLARLAEATRAEPGCRMYLVHRSTEDTRRFFVYERYDDQTAFDAHRASEHFARYLTAGLAPLIDSRTLDSYEPLGE
jgi:quinol monooxygenase YgiN